MFARVLYQHITNVIRFCFLRNDPKKPYIKIIFYKVYFTYKDKFVNKGVFKINFTLITRTSKFINKTYLIRIFVSIWLNNRIYIICTHILKWAVCYLLLVARSNKIRVSWIGWYTKYLPTNFLWPAHPPDTYMHMVIC